MFAGCGPMSWVEASPAQEGRDNQERCLSVIRGPRGIRFVRRLRLESESRAEADAVLERVAEHGSGAQLFGIRSQDGGADGESVLLRILLGRKAA